MTFEELNNKILALENLPGVEFFVIGYSTLGQPIYGVHLGSYEGKQILIEGGGHLNSENGYLKFEEILEFI